MQEMNDSPNDLPWWGRLSTLYLMAPPLAIFLYLLGLPLSPNDYWYHVRAGFLQVQMGHIPTTNLMSGGVPLSQPYHFQSWIAERVMYLLLYHSGLSWTIFFGALWLASTWAVLTAAIFVRMKKLLPALQNENPAAIEKAAAKYAALGCFLALLLASNNVDIRPQVFSYGFFAVFAAVLFNLPREKRRRTLVLIGLPLLMMLWANTHGAFAAGLLLVGALAGVEWLHALWNRHAKIAETREWKFLGVLLLLCAAAATFNPRGVDIYFYVIKLAGNVPSQLYIQEWQSPSLYKPRDWIFFGAIVLSAAAFLFVWRKRRSTLCPPALCPSEFLVLMMFAVMGLRDLRSIIWFAFWLGLCAPTLVAQVRTALGKNALAKPTAIAPARGIAFINVAMAAILILGCAPFLPWVKYRFDLPPSYLKRFAPTPHATHPRGFPGEPNLLLDRETPVEAAAWLQAHPPRGRLFNDMVYGSYLTWALYPQTPPYAEPRVELYELSFWQEFMRISDGPPDAVAWLRKNNFSAALLHPKAQKGLIARLQTAPDWENVPVSGPARLFVLKRR